VSYYRSGLLLGHSSYIYVHFFLFQFDSGQSLLSLSSLSPWCICI